MCRGPNRCTEWRGWIYVRRIYRHDDRQSKGARLSPPGHLWAYPYIGGAYWIYRGNNEIPYKTKKRNPPNTIRYNRYPKNQKRNGKRIGGGAYPWVVQSAYVERLIKTHLICILKRRTPSLYVCRNALMIGTTDHHMRKYMPIIVIMNINSEDKSGGNNTLNRFRIWRPAWAFLS